jgi:hypothetical protein
MVRNYSSILECVEMGWRAKRRPMAKVLLKPAGAPAHIHQSATDTRYRHFAIAQAPTRIDYPAGQSVRNVELASE